jgi:hypothetical protein
VTAYDKMPAVVVVLVPMDGGLHIAAGPLRLLSVVTTPDRPQNPLFCESEPARSCDLGEHDGEVLEVLVAHAPVRTAFPAHDAMVTRFFAR